ncbi:MAG TPA: FAD-dependent oxidoreductase, partial [Clostridia bacterium]|nr:FAD-dependent oxidoreductase [Clostridia bacterium]
LGQELFLDDVEAKKYLIENRMLEHGAQLLFETLVNGVYMEGTRIKGVRVFGPQGERSYGCKVLIDATAEAQVAVMAGCETRLGRESDGRTRPYTSVKVWVTPQGRIARTNHDSGYVNPYSPTALSRAILYGHASQLLEEFADDRQSILFYAPLIGLREGRRIASRHDITGADILDGKFAEEPLFHAYSDFDKHGKDHALESETLQDFCVACNLSTVNFSVPVSLKTLMPLACDNLLCAGRHIGLDHDAASMVRMKRDMHRCGESAGVCAAMAAKADVLPLDLPMDSIRQALGATGCLDARHHTGPVFDDNYRRMPVRWLTDPQAIREQLQTDMPGIALYSCKKLGQSIARHLERWMGEDDPLLSGASALALGNLMQAGALPKLRGIVAERDAFYYKDCRRTNQLRTAMALYLIGKLGDEQSLPLLTQILCEEKEYERPLYHAIRQTSYEFNPNKNFNEVYFQVISHAAIALIKIARRHPARFAQAAALLREAFSSDRHIRNTTGMPPETFEYETIQGVRLQALHFAGPEDGQTKE